MKLCLFPVLLMLTSALWAGAAQAATITEAEAGFGQVLDLDPSDFTASGPCGTGHSVVGTGCSVVLKSDPDATDAYGRRDPWGGAWIDSQDLSEITWTVALEQPFTQLVLALTDAHDQGVSDGFGASHFSLRVGDAIWSIPEREANGTLHWLVVTFAQATTTAQLHFSTRPNDGWGLRAASVPMAFAGAEGEPAPVPLPAPGLLLAGGVGALGLRRRRRRR